MAKRLLVIFLALWLPALSLAEPALIAPETVTPGENAAIHFYLDEAQLVDIWLTREGEKVLPVTQEHESAPGENLVTWDGRTYAGDVPAGDYEMTLYTDGGEVSSFITVEAAPQPEKITVDYDLYPAPGDYSTHTCDHEVCYWKLPMGEMDEAAIWDVMMQPMTVVKGEHQRQIVKVYSQPDTESEPVGEVTCISQGVHVLETLDNGWSLIECYSSSAAKSKVKVFAQQIQGYIQTDRLEVKEPAQRYGLLLDKLTQKMYVFEEGQIIGELLISTGLVNKKQPFNETPAGEFMTVSWSGGFWSGNMYCDMGIRIIAGILIHEVPCLLNKETGWRDYSPFEGKLGQKASHGCIRVQRKENDQGMNMEWLWDNLKADQPGEYTRTRVLIWDDVGRMLPIPDADSPVYYNPTGGKYYHADENCYSVKDRWLPLTRIDYEELDGEFERLTPCAYCNPPMKASEIEAQNEANMAKVRKN